MTNFCSHHAYLHHGKKKNPAVVWRRLSKMTQSRNPTSSVFLHMRVSGFWNRYRLHLATRCGWGLVPIFFFLNVIMHPQLKPQAIVTMDFARHSFHYEAGWDKFAWKFFRVELVWSTEPTWFSVPVMILFQAGFWLITSCRRLPWPHSDFICRWQPHQQYKRSTHKKLRCAVVFMIDFSPTASFFPERCAYTPLLDGEVNVTRRLELCQVMLRIFRNHGSFIY